MSAARRGLEALTVAGTVCAVTLTAHSLVNLSALRRPDVAAPPPAERVSVLLPVRDEARAVAGCLAAVLGQLGVPDLEVLVLDDGSQDGTAEVVAGVSGADPRVRLLRGRALPPGWLGKPHACAQLAQVATGSVLVFLDADVRLAPYAVAATVDLLRGTGLDLVSPYPRQLALTPAERLVQPLLQWSWLTTLPLHVAERSGRPSLSAANGQLLAVDAGIYRRAGGHGAVRDQVIDDVALLRAVKAVGGRGVVVDGTQLATCRMYESWDALREGYEKSLWSAFGSRRGAAAVIGVLALAYLVPPLAALTGSPVGLAGYGAAVVGRCAVAARTGGRPLPDSLAHPASVAALAWLTVRSWQRHARGELSWKGRPLPGAG